MWEKAGVAVSVVYGTMPAESYRVAIGKDIPFEKVGPGLGTARGLLRKRPTAAAAAALWVR